MERKFFSSDLEAEINKLWLLSGLMMAMESDHVTNFYHAEINALGSILTGITKELRDFNTDTCGHKSSMYGLMFNIVDKGDQQDIENLETTLKEYRDQIEARQEREV